MKDVALIIGRFNPFHKGHGQFFKQSNLPTILGIIKGKNSDIIKNPFSIEKQLEIINKAKRNIKNLEDIEIFQNAAIDIIVNKLRSKGYELKKFYCGSDRYDAYKIMIDRWNPKLNSNIEIIVLDRLSNPISGTKIREAIKLNNYTLTKKMMYNLTPNLFNEMKQCINVL